MKGVSGQGLMFVCLVCFEAGNDVILLDLIVILWIGPFELVGQES